MSVIRVTSLAALFLLATSPALLADEEADHQALRDLKGIYEKAVMENDLAQLKPHLHPQFSGVMVTGEIVKSFDELSAYWGKMRELIGEGGGYTFSLEPDRSVLLGDLALSTGTSEDAVVTGGGTSYHFQTAWTALSQRTPDGWKLLRVQGSMDPITNEFVTSGLKGSATTAGLVGGVLGLLLGLILRTLYGRKSR